jgi:hypothetical protein
MRTILTLNSFQDVGSNSWPTLWGRIERSAVSRGKHDPSEEVHPAVLASRGADFHAPLLPPDGHPGLHDPAALATAKRRRIQVNVSTKVFGPLLNQRARPPSVTGAAARV